MPTVPAVVVSESSVPPAEAGIEASVGEVAVSAAWLSSPECTGLEDSVSRRASAGCWVC